MSRKKAVETETEEAPVNKADLPLSQLLLDVRQGKYKLVGQAVRWAYEVKKRDQSTEPAIEILNKALKEILAEQVSIEDIEKLPPVPKETKKPAASLDFAAAAAKLKA
jgi:DNA-directed RNA polymerase subunit K/omega